MRAYGKSWAGKSHSEDRMKLFKHGNGTFNLRTGAVTHRINIRNINPYNDADVK